MQWDSCIKYQTISRTPCSWQERALRLARDIGDEETESKLISNLAACCSGLDDHVRATQYLSHLVRDSEKVEGTADVGDLVRLGS